MLKNIFTVFKSNMDLLEIAISIDLIIICLIELCKTYSSQIPYLKIENSQRKIF